MFAFSNHPMGWPGSMEPSSRYEGALLFLLALACIAFAGKSLVSEDERGH